MAHRTRSARNILSTLTVTAALLVGAQPVTAEASEPDRELTAGLAELARSFGDMFGRIVLTDDAGASIVLARQQRETWVSYVGGDPVSIDDTFALCQESPTGGLDSCGTDPIPFACNEDLGVCICAGIEDCFDLAYWGDCSEDGWICYGEVCACTVVEE